MIMNALWLRLRPIAIDGWQAPIGWAVSAVSAATVTIVKDTAREQELAAIVASWEQKQAGRAAKAKEVREQFLAQLAEAEAATEPEDSAFEALEAEATVTAEPADAPCIVRRAVPVGGAPHLVSSAERDQWREERAAQMTAQAERTEACETTRASIKDSMAALSATGAEAVKAKRAEMQAAYEAALAERQALLSQHLPAPAEPADPVPAKGKKK